MPDKIRPGSRIFITILPFVLAVLVFACVKISIHNPEYVERYYSRGIYPSIADAISFISSLVSYSLWDLAWIMMLLAVTAGIILVFLRRVLIKKFFLRLLQVTALFYSLFYLTWGFNYFRPSMEHRLGWINTHKGDQDFQNVLTDLINSTNENYTEIDYSDYKMIGELLEESYRNLSNQLGLTWPTGTRTAKTILMSSVFAKSGISGYFGPLFNEVHVNHYQLPLDYPFTLAHEKAHQFGIANEAEANMAAFMVCSGSGDIRLRYSGYFHLLLYFLEDAAKMTGYHSFVSRIDERVLRDIRQRQSYYDNLRNRSFEKFQDAANNTYLKSQNIEKGIRNYNQVVSLAMSWYRYSGKIMPGDSDAFAEIN